MSHAGQCAGLFFLVLEGQRAGIRIGGKVRQITERTEVTWALADEQ
jgi:hypothetical protein